MQLHLQVKKHTKQGDCAKKSDLLGDEDALRNHLIKKSDNRGMKTPDKEEEQHG